MIKSTCLLYLLLCVYLVAGCDSHNKNSTTIPDGDSEESRHLYIWAADEDQREGDTDFLAVLDADPSSPSYGDVLNTAVVGAVGTNAHHAEPVAPKGALLFANGYDSGRTFLFDLTQPSNPKLVRELEPIEGFHSPHSFLRLEDGHLLATLQYGDGKTEGDPGGLARFDRQGKLVDVSSAADPAFAGEKIRPYSVEAHPALDRIFTTGRTMNFEVEQAADIVQIWRLSDLELLETLRIPRIPPVAEPECVLGIGDLCAAEQYPGESQPFEGRVLSYGSILMNTLMCGIYRISGLGTGETKIEAVLNYPDMIGCSIPTMIGDYFILPVIFAETIIVLDVSDPQNPIEASRFNTLGYTPHWAAADPHRSRIVVTSDGPKATLTVLMLAFDQESGTLTLDESFGSPEFPRAGVSFYREDWPHGKTGTAIPHAALFGQ